MKRQKARSKMGVKEKALTAASSIASGDFLRMVTSAGAARKIDYSKLAKAIVEEYNGSTIAGSAQTLKAALDSLNSKTDVKIYAPATVTTYKELLDAVYDLAGTVGTYLGGLSWAGHGNTLYIASRANSTRARIIIPWGRSIYMLDHDSDSVKTYAKIEGSNLE